MKPLIFLIYSEIKKGIINNIFFILLVKKIFRASKNDFRPSRCWLLGQAVKLVFFAPWLIALFHFSPAGKKRAYFPLYVFEKKRVSYYKLCEENKSIKLQMLALKKIKLSRLLVQRINEFKINEIQ